ncbi:hypothetical protein B0T22DRAFT_466964 [Podospora appendiculata]|uniref:Secreted protein n=1 Tax=Podospora appendiculata TaxID=314037 RepID=A0AAE0X6H0_9PEZI|nr:hypothetical protein B0T22DRAFT_466964 [Podospora appendiculata]
MVANLFLAVLWLTSSSANAISKGRNIVRSTALVLQAGEQEETIGSRDCCSLSFASARLLTKRALCRWLQRPSFTRVIL